MSVYQVSKFLFAINRDEDLKRRFRQDPEAALRNFRLTPEERGALSEPDIGLLYVLGVNGQILMHYAAFWGVEWSDYLQLMRDGVVRHGPVREGIYAMTTDPRDKIAGA